MSCFTTMRIRSRDGVYVPLRSAQNRRPPDVLRPIRPLASGNPGASYPSLARYKAYICSAKSITITNKKNLIFFNHESSNRLHNSTFSGSSLLLKNETFPLREGSAFNNPAASIRRRISRAVPSAPSKTRQLSPRTFWISAETKG